MADPKTKQDSKAVDFQNVDIIFGKEPQEALALLDGGATRDEILDKTNNVVGVAGASLAIEEGEICVLMGLSGSGKSTLLRAVNGLNKVTRGAIMVRDQNGMVDVASCDPTALRHLRMNRVAMVFQQFALLPWRTVAENVGLGLELRGMDKKEREAIVDEKLELVSLSQWKDKFAHELSGGMQQRALLAAALACGPQLLVADEPTTALDPTVQASVLSLLDELRRERGMALLFITHDRHLVPLLADRRVELAAGRVIADGPAAGGAEAPAPSPGGVPAAAPRPLLVGRGLRLRHGDAPTEAVAGVDLALAAGEVVGLAGESGSGKTTLARLLCGQLRPQAGSVQLDGADLASAGGARGRTLRRGVQLLFQHAGGSLDPRQTVAASLAEAAGGPVDPAALLQEVDLAPELAGRLPHRMSGGQRQRAALARCLAARPRVLIADEPASALDPATRRLVLGLLLDAARSRRLALLLVSHDLDELLGSCDRVLVMLAGVVIEELPGRGAAQPAHPYTQALQAAQPAALAALGARWRLHAAAAASDFARDLRACPYREVCPLVKSICHKGLPSMQEIGDGHRVRCPLIGQEHAPQFIDTY